MIAEISLLNNKIKFVNSIPNALQSESLDVGGYSSEELKYYS